jgi:glycerol kinase
MAPVSQSADVALRETLAEVLAVVVLRTASGEWPAQGSAKVNAAAKRLFKALEECHKEHCDDDREQLRLFNERAEEEREAKAVA